VLIDTGMPHCGAEIYRVAGERFGKDNPPRAVVLTHGHFDHVGGVVHLAEQWSVPVYAHPLEFPFLKGAQRYPRPDPSVEGGFLAKISFVYPITPVDVSPALHALPDDGSVPFLPGWQWVHTPGHSPGHVSLFRSVDGMLISGDAIITVRQDSLYKVLIQQQEINGPPVYLTTDWDAAEASVRKLQALHPSVMVPGHGPYMKCAELTEGISDLVENFRAVAVPSHGKYVHR
jgi:glyoxylase-like metal-dependent hydrolase (beta-lactamase superfamily II)